MTQWYWVVLEQSANLVEAAMLVIFISRFFEPRFRGSWIFAVSVAGVFALINALNALQSPGELSMPVYFFVGFLICSLFFKSGILGRILIPLLIPVLVVTSEILTLGVLQIIFHVDDSVFMTETTYRMLGIVTSKPLLIIMVYGVSRFSKKEQAAVPLVYSLCILTIPLVSAVCMITLIEFVIDSGRSVLNPAWLAISAAGLLFMSLLAIYLFQALMEYGKKQSQYQLMSQQVEMLGKHLQERSALQEETNRIWHDMKNHFTVIQWMVNSKSYDKLEQYMLNLNDIVTDSMLKIQTGNPILDALLNSKAAEARKSGIGMDVKACVPPGISIEDIDLNIVFSNALDNAMEACRKLPEGEEKFISLETYVRNDHLFLVIRNSFDGIVRKAGDVWKTTKADSGRHGIGMGNMKRAVEKYDGHIMAEADGRVFKLSVAMYCMAGEVKAIAPKNTFHA